KLQYKDYSEWQNSEERQLIIKQQEDFWIRKFEKEIPVLNLPLDNVRPAIQTYEGANVNFALSKEETQKIKSLSNENGLTLYMTILSVYTILLSKLSQQKDIIVGTPTAGRNHVDLKRIVGVFINTLAIRNDLKGDKTVLNYLQELKRTTLEVFENQDYQFEDLVEQISVERDMSRNPVFDVMFNFLNQTEYTGDISELDRNIYVHKPSISKFDLSLAGVDYGDQLMLNFEYSTKLFKAETIERFITYFKQIVNQIEHNLEKNLSALEIIDQEEKQQLLYEFNNTKIDYPKDKTIHQLFEEQREKDPLKIAVYCNGESISFKDLGTKSDRLASYIFNLAGENGIIGIIADRSIEMIIGILAVLKSGNAYLPLDLRHPQDRNHKILKESDVRIVLSDHQDLQIGDIDVVNLLSSEVYPKNIKSKSKNSKSTDPAYVIFTSGSTGVPKGVMVSHRSVVNLINGISGLIPENNSGTMLSLTTISFDIFGLELYTPLLNGFSLVLAKDEDQYSAEKIASIVQNQAVKILQLTPSRLGLILADEFSKDIFNEIEVLFLGGEELPATLLSNLRDLYKGKVYNMYGPTETTIWSTIKDVSEDLPLNIGKPINNTQVYILGLQNELIPIGVSGELCISGDGLAIGYLKNSELTREKFIEHPFKKGERLYKTGDLACWLPDGNIEFLGRIDSQVKIRGFRIELGEIENALQQYENIKECVVIAREENEDKYLCAYLVTAEELNQEEIRTYLSESLPDYMIPTYFVKMEKIPLTSNGKINRKALPSPEIKADNLYQPPTNDIEEKLVQLWSKVLKVPLEEISVDANFFSLGGHSLRATILTSKIHKELGVKIPLAEIFKLQTIRKLSKYIKEGTKIDYSSIDLIAKRDYYPLSSAQRRLYFLQRLDLGSISYNMPIVMPWNENVDIEHLESIFKKLIIRHESLRTSIVTINNEPVQKIQDQVDFHLDYFETSNQEEAESLIKDYIKPFNLTEAPLLRSCIIKFQENKHIWIVDMHHIISDGTSSSLLIDDFMSFYKGEQLKPLKLQYKDFSEWQNKLITNTEIKTQEKYWTDLLSGDIPMLQLPADHNRPKEFSFEGDIHSFVLENEVALKFRELGTKNSATLFMNMLAAFNVLFYKYTSQTDIIIGSGIAGRPHADLQNIVGMFVNTLAMRNYPEGEKTYTDFLKEVAGSSVMAFENQNVQFEDLVDKLEVERDTSRNPLFDIFMIVQNFGEAQEEQVKEEVVRDIKALNETSLDVDYRNTTSKFDMTFYVNEQGENIYINIEYYTRIFKKETIIRLVSCFNNILKEVINNPEIKLKEIELLSKEEKEQLLYKFNDTQADYPKDKTIQELFEEQVDKNPENIALVCDQEKVTYRELDNRSNQLAHYLRFECEVSKDENIGVYMDKGSNVIIAILGILKSGCGYLPLSATYPEERITFMINDASTRVIISEKQYVKEMNKFQWECSLLSTYICLDSYNVKAEQETQNKLNDKRLWEYVGDTSVDEVTGGGWTSSYTGKPIPQEEMDEYGDNVLKKLEPLINSQTRILEIGCASGITMFRLAPKVGLYYGTDLSRAILRINEERINSEGHTNIIQEQLSADEIDLIEEKDFDLVIINSVIQCFDGHNYLKKVIRKAIDLMKPEGLMFFGDIMDQDLKKDLVKDFEGFRQINKTKDYKTKIDWSEELFLSRGFWDDLRTEESSIEKIECTPKIFTLENELTKFRYDVLVSINKNQEKRVSNKPKNKQQHDLNILSNYSIDRLPKINTPENLAYIIYTSGTTGKPKGVMVEHRNVIRLFFNDKFQFDFSEKDIWTMFHSHSFDFSVWEMFGALLYGGKLIVIPEIVAKDVVKYYNILCEEKVTVLNQTPSAFYNLAEVAISNSEKTLENLKYVIFGGEALKPNKLKKWFDVYSDVNLINMYGITETTVHVTYKKIGKYEIENNISNIGTPIPTLTTYIMNSDLKLVPIGIAGELLIGGDGLSRGYLGKEELTKEKFITNPYKEGERLYRSGDLVKMLSNGEMEYLGRIDNQVQLRGFRIELGEIENALHKYENVKESVVVAREDNGDKNLCAYVVCEDEFNQDEVRAYLLETLPDYMIPSYFVELEKIPLTTNGKVDRKSLPSPEVKAGDAYVAASTETEEKLVEIWSEVLNIPQKEISTTASFFDIGGHSLKATVLTAAIHKKIGVEFPLRDVFIHLSIKAQASQIEISTKKEFVSIPKAQEQSYYSLSSAQKRMYLLQQMDLESTVYNMPYSISIGVDVDKVKIEEILNQIISRHESFRTSFEIPEENPVQHIHEKVDFQLEKITIELSEEQATRNKFIRAFDLTKAPLLRAAIIEIKGLKNVLLIDTHHIISDGVSHSILEQEFQSLSLGEELLPLKLQYKDYSEWQNSEERQLKVKEQENYWIKKFEGEIPVLDLPLDYVRPVIQSHEGGSVMFALSNQETENIKSLAKENDLTLYMTVLSAFSILLSKLSGQEDIIVGTPTAGRNHDDLKNIVGVFVNTISIRNDLKADKTVLNYIQELKQTTLEVFENQDYQFEDLVEQVSVVRDMSRNPIFDVMFNLLNQTEYAGDISALDRKKTLHSPSISKFDLTLSGADYGDRLVLNFEYCIKLFKAETIDRYIRYFKKVVNQITENLEKNLSEIEIISDEEKQQLLYEFNNTTEDYPKEKTVINLFEEQVLKTPENTALIFKEEKISYSEFNENVNQAVNYLLTNGVKKGDVVGVISERSMEMMVSIFAVLKAGAVYLPIDPNYPEKRINYIFENSQTKIVLCQEKYSTKLSSNIDNILILGNWQNQSQTNKETNIHCSPNDLAYIIYTSGSTGNPKGVMIDHYSLTNRLNWMGKAYPVNSDDVFIQKTTIVFDVSVWELFWWAIEGSTLFLLNQGEEKEPLKLINAIEKNKVSVMHFVPSMLNAFLEELESKAIERLCSLKFVFSSGEALSNNTVSRFNQLLLPENKTKLINLYGPTEATIDVSYFNCYNQTTLDIVPIGKPIDNVKLYVVSKDENLSPIGVAGELYIGGDCLSRGYLNNDKLTSEKFIINPFDTTSKVYKTGDLVRWLPDGNIEFLGRIDHQVKIRGFRIELGEIEKTLLKNENIKEAVVIAREDKQDKYLCAYVVGEEELNPDDLRTYLFALLPDYMIPSYFVQIDDLPITSNGKVNRKALPSPDFEAGDNYIAASNPLEEQLVKIWEEVLNIQPIGVTDNFYKIGGNSLLAITLLNKIEKKLGERIQLSIFLQNLTIKELSIFIYQLFSWSANFHLDEAVIKNKNVISSVRIANLQTKGENLPIFFVAPLGGILPATSIVGIMDIPLLLGEEQPFYSVQVPPLFSDLAQTISTGGELNLSDHTFKEDVIQQHVKECIQSIKNIYKGEELYIGGFCTGCIFAMELAAQIEKSGFKVKEVFLIDPPLKENFSDNPNNKEYAQISELNFNIDEIAWFIAKDLGWKEKINLKDVISVLKNANTEEIWDVGTNILKSHKTVSETTTSQELKISYYTKFYNQELITTYLSVINYKYPNIEAEKTSLIVAGMEEIIKNKEFVDIVSKYFKNTVAIENITGDHGSVFQQPNINQLVEIIKKSVHSGLNQ
ncbi:MAG: amino acid adenylation domain-containing protein, partial [Bacteroidales bacterium]|nr:amino acid adenylation domain-containing protein [Bacteroidales bacterium]